MNLIGSRDQQRLDDYYDASGSITTGGVAQLLLPQRKACSFLLIANTSSALLSIQIGVRPAVATLTNGVVTGVSVTDAGFGFLFPPSVYVGGGGNANDPHSYGATMPDWPSPNNPAQIRPVMSGGAISSFLIDNGGSGYLAAPFIYVQASRRDPTGVGIPSATVGIPLTASGGNYYVNGTYCPTTAISIWGATTGQTFTCKWAP